jgi:beta-glucanase (GH16 family)
LVWSDEFDEGMQPNPEKWSYQVGGGGWGNQELQYYTDSRPENARIENGTLIIEARRESFGGSPYSSARLRSLGKGDWLYGRFEIRARLPEGLGTWAAIWMMPSEDNYGDGGWPDNGEIDIMEAVGHEPDRTHSAVHTRGLNHQLGNNPFATHINATSRSDFHVYAMEWTPTRITTFVDGDVNLVYDRDGAEWEKWPFDRPFHLLLNLAVGGSWGGAQGVNPDDFPATMEVDYVRVFRDLSGPPTLSLTTEDGRVSYDTGETIRLTVDASDPVSDIANVSLFQGDGLLASSESSIIELSLGNVQPGCYTIHATAQDEDGWGAGSDTLNVIVGGECQQAPYFLVAPRIPGEIEAEYYDLGGPGVAYLELTAQNTSGALRAGEGVDIGPSSDIGGGYQIENVTLREWVEYTVDVQESGQYRMVARLAATRDGEIQLAIDEVGWPDDLVYAATNSTTFFRNATLDGIWLEKGLRTLRLGFSNFGVVLNKFSFQLVSATTTDVVPIQNELTLSAYPNPFSGSLTIDTGTSLTTPARLLLLDATGKQVFEKKILSTGGGREIILIEPEAQLASGLYLIVLQIDGMTYSQPVIRMGKGKPPP